MAGSPNLLPNPSSQDVLASQSAHDPMEQHASSLISFPRATQRVRAGARRKGIARLISFLRAPQRVRAGARPKGAARAFSVRPKGLHTARAGPLGSARGSDSAPQTNRNGPGPQKDSAPQTNRKGPGPQKKTPPLRLTGSPPDSIYCGEARWSGRGGWAERDANMKWLLAWLTTAGVQ